MEITPAKEQAYFGRNEVKIIPAPQVGSILTRTSQKTEEVKMFVVIKTFKRRGHELVTLIHLMPVDKFDDGKVTYQTNTYPIIHQLNSYGHWWNNHLNKEFIWDFISYVV